MLCTRAFYKIRKPPTKRHATRIRGWTGTTRNRGWGEERGGKERRKKVIYVKTSRDVYQPSLPLHTRSWRQCTRRQREHPCCYTYVLPSSGFGSYAMVKEKSRGKPQIIEILQSTDRKYNSSFRTLKIYTGPPTSTWAEMFF